jgi:hypothetical protein
MITYSPGTSFLPRRYPKTVIPTEARRLFPSAREVEGSLSLIAHGWPNAVAIDHLIHERLADSEKPTRFRQTFSQSVVLWTLVFLRLRAETSARFLFFDANISLS